MNIDRIEIFVRSGCESFLPIELWTTLKFLERQLSVPHCNVPLPIDLWLSIRWQRVSIGFEGMRDQSFDESQVRADANLLKMIVSLIVALFVQIGAGNGIADTYRSPWYYKCEGGLCKKERMTKETTEPVTLEVCELFCGASSTLWPKPTGHLSLSGSMVELDPEKISLDVSVENEGRVERLLWQNVLLLRRNARNSAGKLQGTSGGVGMLVRCIGIDRTMDGVRLTLNTDESYGLSVTRMNETMLEVTITAKTYFGARHAMESLSQMIVFDDSSNRIRIPNEISITDAPVYPYRGIMLDSSRNFVDKATILRTIDGMSMSKLNTLHWHIVDSQSFPYASRTWPEFSRYGAYAANKVYDEKDVREIVEYGLVRGVRVLPEFDAPAHVGEGWQWVGNDAIVCFNAQPWRSYCVEPPCGQLNPTDENVYALLEGIYKDMMEDFQPDLFHMGGDEVNMNCWNSSAPITSWMKNVKGWNLTESSFYMLWDYFQGKALEKLRIASGGKRVPVILWTSGLTNAENLKYLDPAQYIVQIWTSRDDSTIGRLLRNNFRIIFSNYDALYLDCGFSAWVGEGNNWCAPYKGWQKVYDNSPRDIVESQRLRSKMNLVLGGEVALWTEQADGASVDTKVWPRAAALAERLWAEPNSTWIHAERRMLRHRERLVRRGIAADRLEPEWCLQNQGQCYA